MRIEEQVLSREQMAHLKELGVDTSDASMMWYCCKDAQKERWYLQINNELSQCFARMIKGFVPTYTIGDLIEKLPKKINEGMYFYIDYNSHIAGYSKLKFWVMYEPLIKILYSILCWVARNHKELIK